VAVEMVRGDLFAVELPALAHGCTGAGAMGKGIAVEFKRRWPSMYAEYHQLCEQGRFRLGDVFVWSDGAITVFNLATQGSFKGRVRAELGAVEQALAKMLVLAEERAIAAIGMPRIGAGLGGLVWEEVRAVIQRLGAASPVRLVVFEELVPGL
jgi:O-acetyl-ADP-ribose deacetylase (regulator of RNase III)